ncbi:MAG: hypothetical protein K1X55_03215 [Chitinophagales bacterium]|nr:hypothetical protein [Chitinophagales bacterium]
MEELTEKVFKDKAFSSDSEKLGYCDTQYPLILVSGMGFKEHNFILNYWGTIPDYLKSHGAEVYTANQDAFCGHVENAMKLKKRINDILNKTGKEKINIIAHSKGGIEARYMVSKLNMGSKTASLTTIGSPHHGSGLADIIVGKIPIGRFAAARLVNIYAMLMGDRRPDSLRAVVQVTTEAMKRFNKEVENHPDVYYQSYASHVNKQYPNIMWRTMAGLLYVSDGKNDGIVSIESAKWGNYQGLIQTEASPSINHADQVGLTQFSGNLAFDAHNFYLELVRALKTAGH